MVLSPGYKEEDKGVNGFEPGYKYRIGISSEHGTVKAYRDGVFPGSALCIDIQQKSVEI